MYKILISAVLIGGILQAFSIEDESMGVIPSGQNMQVKNTVKLPDNFNPENAQKELINARRAGDSELAEKLSLYLHEWWKKNRDNTLPPENQGYNPEPGPGLQRENNNNNNSPGLKWGNDVRIDPRDGVRDVKVTSLSNGELYAIALYSDTSDHVIFYRSTDNGETWSECWNFDFTSNYNILSPGILAVNDTLVAWYILRLQDTLYRTWFITFSPGPTLSPIYWGSPTGNFNDNVIYKSLDFTSDAPVFGTGEYNYATWVEVHYTSSPSVEDSTRVMFARTNELDVSNWEIGPVRVNKTFGDNIYFYKAKIAFGGRTGARRLWIVSPIHPNLYPGTYDELIEGVYSDNYGSTWSSFINITPSDDRYDDYDADIAASYIDSNWVVLTVRTDTGSLHGYDRDIYNVYSTNNGNTWNDITWVTTDSVNVLPDIYVDNASTAFYGVFRKDYSGLEEVRLKIGDINNPAYWTYSGDNIVNDDNTQDLSIVYGPSVSYNPSTGDPVVVWTSFEGYVYSIWFDALSRVDVAEKTPEHSNGIKLLTIPQRKGVKISFFLPFSSKVNLNLYSAEGRKIRTIINSNLNKGTYSYSISNLKSGKYFLKLNTGNIKETKSLIIVK